MSSKKALHIKIKDSEFFSEKIFIMIKKNALTDAAEYDKMEQSIDEEKYLTAFTFRERKTVRPPQQNRRE